MPMNNTFSVNMLKTFDTCIKKFDFKYNQKISMPQNPELFEKGKKIHALANYYLRGANITKLETALSNEEKEVWEKLKSNEFFSKKCLHSEYNITSKVGDYWVFGRLDALMKDGEDYFILDYKTGQIPQNPQNDFQTMVYLICADKILKEYNSLKFIYIDLKNNKNHVIEFSNSQRDIFENAIISKCKAITETKNFDENLSSSKCKYCEYKKICVPF